MRPGPDPPPGPGAGPHPLVRLAGRVAPLASPSTTRPPRKQSPPAPGNHPRRRITDWVVPEANIPNSLEALEESCRLCLDRLNRAECPEEAARLLARLHHLRRALRDLDLPPAEASDDLADSRPTVLGTGS